MADATIRRPRPLPGLEGLRGIAALGVLLAHVQAHMAPDLPMQGALRFVINHLSQGLTLFFVLSGFLLYLPFASALLAGRPLPSVGKYLRRRFFRIFPAYWFVLLVAGLGLGLVYTTNISDAASVATQQSAIGRLTNPVLLAMNLALVQTFVPFSIKTGLSVSWSLTTELSFYALLPVLAGVGFLIARRASAGSVRRSMAVLVPPIVLFVLGCVGAIWAGAATASPDPSQQFYLEWGSTWSAVLARSVLAQGALFAVGMLGAAFVARWQRGRESPKMLRRVRLGAMVVITLAVIANLLLPITELSVAAIGVGVIVLLVAAARGARPNPVARVLDSRIPRFFGDMSYGIYLWHVPVIWGLVLWFGLASDSLGGYLLACLLAALVSTGLAYLTHRFIEVPFIRLGRRAQTGR